MTTTGIITAIIIALIIVSGFRIANEYERGVVFRLGRFREVKGPGLYWIIPLIEWQKLIDIRTRTVTVERQETITRDSVTVKVDAVLWYRVVDTAKAVIAVENYGLAVHQIALTSLRNIIGQHLLDEVLKERNSINQALKNIVDGATEAWGIEVELVEMKDVEIPEAMQRAMAREAEAVREKRARIIKAEAEQEASLKLSDGARQIAENPIALELRRMQMIAEVGAEQNTTTVVLMPSDFVNLAREFSQLLSRQSSPAASQEDN